jgi:hypothetical protein
VLPRAIKKITKIASEFGQSGQFHFGIRRNLYAQAEVPAPPVHDQNRLLLQLSIHPPPALLKQAASIDQSRQRGSRTQSIKIQIRSSTSSQENYR